MNKHSSFTSIFRPAGLLLAWLSVGAQAATYNWQGDTNANFTDGANWVENTWTQWDDYHFGSDVVNGAVTINGYFGIGSLSLQSGLTQDIVITSSNPQPVIMSTAIANSGLALISIAADSRDLTINGEYIASTGVTWDVGSGRTLNMTGQLKDWFATASLVKQGAGTAVLAGNNTYAGQTNIQGGTLLVTSSTGLGPGGHNGGTMTFIQDGATLALQGGVSLDEHFHVWGAGVGGLGAVRSISGNNALTNAPGGGAGYALRSNTTVGVDAGTLTMSGFYQEAGTWGLTKIGAGTLSLTAANTFTGGTTINAGVVNIAAQNSMQNSPVVVNSGAVLQTSVDWGTGWSHGAGMGAITINAGGTLRTGAVANAIRNGLNLNGGTVEATGGTNYNWGQYVVESTVTVAGSSTSTITADLRFRDTSTVNVGVTGDPSGVDLLMSGKVGHVNNVAWGYMNKQGSGTLKMTGQNEIGGITVSAGKLILEDAAADWSVNSNGLNNGAQVDLSVPSGTRSIAVGLGGTGTYTKTGAGTLNANTLINSYGNQTAVIVDGGTLHMTGGHNNFWYTNSVTINSGAKLSNNTHSHIQAITLNGGELASTGTDYAWGGWMLDQDVSVIGTGTSVISADRVAVANASNVSRVFTVAGTATLNVTGKFEDAATTTNNGMTKAGAGTMILAGNNAYTGPTTVSNGLLISQNGTGIPDLSTVVMADSASAALQITQSEQVGLLTGGGTSGGNIIVASGATLTTGNNDGSGSYDGIISGSNVSLNKRGGGTQTLTGANTFSGGVTIQNGTLSVPSITTVGLAQPLGTGGGPIVLSGASGLAVTGAGTYATSRGLTLANNANTLSVTGTLTLTGGITGGGSSATFTKAGAGTFNQSGTGSWNSNVFITEGTYNVTSTGSIGNAGVIRLTNASTFNINTADQVRAASLDLVSGTVNLTAGTLRTNGITMASGTAFNWSAGTLTMQNDAAGNSGVSDRRAPGSSLSAQPVYEGRIIDVSGAAAAVAIPDGATLDLGPTYGSLGMRYDQLRIAGSLDLTASGSQTLHFEFNPFFFRPSVFGADGAGTLILVDATSLSGTFENFTGVYSDYIGFTAAPGSGSVVGVMGTSTLNPLTDIPANTYYLEYESDTGNVLFHYRLTATIPEPASAGLIAMGAALLRVLRRRRG